MGKNTWIQWYTKVNPLGLGTGDFYGYFKVSGMGFDG